MNQIKDRESAFDKRSQSVLPSNSNGQDMQKRKGGDVFINRHHSVQQINVDKSRDVSPIDRANLREAASREVL